jgi:hypothetical protein
MYYFTMQTKTLVIATVIVAVTAAFAIAPFVTSSAMALRNGGSQSTTTCQHNGNGASSSPDSGGNCGPGASSTPITTTTYKCQGKFQTTPC